MVKELPDIGTPTAECVEEPGTPGYSAMRRHLLVGAMPARGNRSAATERASAGAKTRAGWFHRSSPDKVQWIPADGGDLRTRSPEPARNGRNLSAASLPTRPYTVAEVKGCGPAGLDAFLGVTSFTVLSGDLTVLVFGAGEQSADGVRFQQQDPGRDGKQIRTWLITTGPDGIVAFPSTSV